MPANNSEDPRCQPISCLLAVLASWRFNNPWTPAATESQRHAGEHQGDRECHSGRGPRPEAPEARGPTAGFAIPQGRWFQTDLRRFAEDILLEPTALSRGYFREDTLRWLLRHHATGRRDYGTWIWCLIVLETWFRQFEAYPPSAENATTLPTGSRTMISRAP
jgi:Asparagine synthase